MPRQHKPQSLGKRLMSMRKKKGLALKNLANETGLKPNYISQVEKGAVIPPVSVILQLSSALEIDSSILLREKRQCASEKATRDYQRRTEAYTYENLAPEAKHKHLKAFKVFIEPKSDHQGVSYQHAGEEFIYVLTGRLEVVVGDNRNTLEPHECLHFNSSIVHKLRNLGAEKAELLVVLYTP